MNGNKGAIAIIKLNGEAIVSVSTRSYDPNKMTAKYYEELKKNPDKPLFNRALDGRYEPGSVWKTVIAVSLLEKNKQGKPVVCNGGLKVGKKTIRCMGRHGAVILSCILKDINIYYLLTTIFTRRYYAYTTTISSRECRTCPGIA